jgi:hypothetical protein
MVRRSLSVRMRTRPWPRVCSGTHAYGMYTACLCRSAPTHAPPRAHHTSSCWPQCAVRASVAWTCLCVRACVRVCMREFAFVCEWRLLRPPPEQHHSGQCQPWGRVRQEVCKPGRVGSAGGRSMLCACVWFVVGLGIRLGALDGNGMEEGLLSGPRRRTRCAACRGHAHGQLLHLYRPGSALSRGGITAGRDVCVGGGSFVCEMLVCFCDRVCVTSESACCVAVLLCCCVAVLLCCCVAVLLCCCVAVLLCCFVLCVLCVQCVRVCLCCMCSM